MAIPSKLLDQVRTLPEPMLRELRQVIDEMLPVDDGGAELDDAERRRLHASLDAAEMDEREGRGYSADDVLAELRRL